MVKVAQWKARGIHAGQVVQLRRVTAVQLWRVVAKIRKPADDGTDQVDEQVFVAKQPCRLREMYEIVMQSLGDVLDDGERVRDASLEFYIGGKG